MDDFEYDESFKKIEKLYEEIAKEHSQKYRKMKSSEERKEWLGKLELTIDKIRNEISLVNVQA